MVEWFPKSEIVNQLLIARINSDYADTCPMWMRKSQTVPPSTWDKFFNLSNLSMAMRNCPQKMMKKEQMMLRTKGKQIWLSG